MEKLDKKLLIGTALGLLLYYALVLVLSLATNGPSLDTGATVTPHSFPPIPW